MGRAQVCCFSQRDRHIIIFLLFLLVSSSTLVRFTAEGKFISKELEAAQLRGEEGVKVAVGTAQIIGSRPPRCDRRCSSCGHCEAVQVPVTTQNRSHRRSHLFSAAFSTIAYSRGDDATNYKPMSWKCKCGNLIFNP